MATHPTGPYAGFSCDGQRLFDELDRILSQPNGLQQLFNEFGKRQVCDAILSEEEPLWPLTVKEIKEMLDGMIADRPHLTDRKFDISVQLIPDEPSDPPKQNHN